MAGLQRGSAAIVGAAESDLGAVAEGLGWVEAWRGEVLVELGDRGVPFFVVTTGEIEIVRPYGATETLITTHGPGEFTGEVNMLSGRRTLVRMRASQPGEVIEVARERFGKVHRGAFDDPRLELAVGDGLAYLRARQGKEAVGEFRKYLANPGVAVECPFNGLARLGAARGVDLGQQQPRALAREAKRERAPDAVASAGDERGFTFEEWFSHADRGYRR